MGRADIECRKFMSDKAHFADVVNYYVFDGRQIVRPNALSPLDTAGFVAPYGNGARSPVQKYRDTVKLWSAMTDEKVVYVILGAENQTEVHYAMPVRSGLYDFLNYAGQVSEAGKRYRKKTQKENGSAIKLTNGEYLSGFRKDDKLIPVITLVVFFSNTEWDGPMTIHEMLNTQDRQILDLVQGVNLLAEDLGRNREDRRDSYNGSSVIVNTLACAEDRLAGRSRRQQQNDMLALDHHL
jgi:hypothetical protein